MASCPNHANIANNEENDGTDIVEQTYSTHLASVLQGDSFDTTMPILGQDNVKALDQAKGTCKVLVDYPAHAPDGRPVVRGANRALDNGNNSLNDSHTRSCK